MGFLEKILDLVKEHLGNDSNLVAGEQVWCDYEDGYLHIKIVVPIKEKENE